MINPDDLIDTRSPMGDLSMRARVALLNHTSVRTMGDLARYVATTEDEDILRVPGMGRKTLYELKEVTIEMGKQPREPLVKVRQNHMIAYRMKHVLSLDYDQIALAFDITDERAQQIVEAAEMRIGTTKTP